MNCEAKSMIANSSTNATEPEHFANTRGTNHSSSTLPCPIMRVNACTLNCDTLDEYSKQIHERARLINSVHTPANVRKLVRQGSDLSLEDLRQITLSIKKKA